MLLGVMGLSIMACRGGSPLYGKSRTCEKRTRAVRAGSGGRGKQRETNVKHVLVLLLQNDLPRLSSHGLERWSERQMVLLPSVSQEDRVESGQRAMLD